MVEEKIDLGKSRDIKIEEPDPELYEEELKKKQEKDFG